MGQPSAGTWRPESELSGSASTLLCCHLWGGSAGVKVGTPDRIDKSHHLGSGRLEGAVLRNSDCLHSNSSSNH